MSNLRTRFPFKACVVLILALLTAPSSPPAWAASHREAPLIALDPAADITDSYLFMSYEPGRENRVVLIMNVIPGQEPSSGPNYFNFDDDVLYAVNLDINGDGNAEDLVYEIRFKTEIRSPFDDFPVSYAGLPPIERLDGAGSEGLGLRQTYTVTEVRGRTRTRLFRNQRLVAVPSNIGPATIPDYEGLAAQGVYIDPGTDVRVFAGQGDETFYIDLGATFDTLNFRRNPPVLSNAEDANDAANPFGVDMFSGFNINTIALEIPVSRLVGNPASQVIGMYASTSRSARREFLRDSRSVGGGRHRQVARLANPLVNELIIGTGQKDRWNATEPEQEAIFLDFYRNPRLATILNIAFGLPVPATPRQDLVRVLLKYPGQAANACSRQNPCSELLRLDVSVSPTPAEQQRRLTVLAHDDQGNSTPDPAGWPNGRRPNDDVTDLALRVVAGVISGDACCGGSPHTRLGDGVNFNIGAPGTSVTANGISTKFPFLPTPHSGRDRRHIDPGE